MSPANSSLDTLLRVRQHRRDLCRIALVELNQRDDVLRAEQNAIRFESETATAELRSLESNRTLDVKASVARRRHLGDLVRELRELEQRRHELLDWIDEQGERLLLSDQNVQSLEKLLDRREAEATAVRLRKEARELDEMCRAAS
jgi:flagellar biosynthesis chaperone FliJ